MIRLRCGGIFNDCFITGLLMSPMVKKISRIGQHLTKSLARVRCPVLSLNSRGIIVNIVLKKISNIGTSPNAGTDFCH